jgi:hypothetical protein
VEIFKNVRWKRSPNGENMMKSFFAVWHVATPDGWFPQTFALPFTLWRIVYSLIALGVGGMCVSVRGVGGCWVRTRFIRFASFAHDGPSLCGAMSIVMRQYGASAGTIALLTFSHTFLLSTKWRRKREWNHFVYWYTQPHSTQ